MKKIILFFYLLFFGTFITNAQNNNDLIFKDGNQTIKIEFETKQPYLELNKNTKFIVIFYRRKKWRSIHSPNIRLCSSWNDYFLIHKKQKICIR